MLKDLAEFKLHLRSFKPVTFTNKINSLIDFQEEIKKLESCIEPTFDFKEANFSFQNSSDLYEQFYIKPFTSGTWHELVYNLFCDINVENSYSLGFYYPKLAIAIASRFSYLSMIDMIVDIILIGCKINTISIAEINNFKMLIVKEIPKNEDLEIMLKKIESFWDNFWNKFYGILFISKNHINTGNIFFIMPEDTAISILLTKKNSEGKSAILYLDQNCGGKLYLLSISQDIIYSFTKKEITPDDIKDTHFNLPHIANKKFASKDFHPASYSLLASYGPNGNNILTIPHSTTISTPMETEGNLEPSKKIKRF